MFPFYSNYFVFLPLLCQKPHIINHDYAILIIIICLSQYIKSAAIEIYMKSLLFTCSGLIIYNINILIIIRRSINMIKNIIFDIGNVLISFNPIDYLSHKFDDEVLRQALYNTIFKSKEWLMLDRGTLTEEEAVHIFCTRQPHLQNQIKYVMENWHEMHIPMNESVQLLKHFKSSGYHIYLLSNYHKKAFKIISERYDFIREVDGRIISCDVKLLKPEKSIYEALLNTYGLKPEECLFLDDAPENIEAANRLGINGVCFKDAESIYGFIDNFNVV